MTRIKSYFIFDFPQENIKNIVKIFQIFVQSLFLVEKKLYERTYVLCYTVMLNVYGAEYVMELGQNNSKAGSGSEPRWRGWAGRS